MNKKINFLGCPINKLTMAETLARIDSFISQKKPLKHVVVNAAKIVNMQKDRQLFESVVNSNLINADGQAIVWASRFLQQPLPERVAGIDLMQNLVKLAHEKEYRVFFFGAKEDVVKAVVERYTKDYSPDIIAGYRNGYYNKDQEETIARQIAASKAQILFVAISSPTKEIFLDKYKDLLQIPFIMGVGGSFDVVAGKVKRAPEWMQRCGMEWFYRVLQEPRRMWKRYLVTNTLFIYYVFKEKLRLLKRRS